MTAILREKLVFITPVLPDPTGSGSEQRAYSFLLAYSKMMDVTLWFSVRQSGLHMKRLAKIAPLCSEIYFFHPNLLQNDISGLYTHFVDTLVAADHVHVFKLSFGVMHKSIIWDFDELPPDLRGGPSVAMPVVTTLGTDRTAGEIFADFAKTCRLVIASSPLEQHRSLGPVVPVDNCYHTQLVRRGADPATPGLLFVGTFSYVPNVDAVSFFRAEILPLLPADLRVTMVGRGPNHENHREVLTKTERETRIHFKFDVESLTPFYDDATIAIVPLRHGSGTRLKILEAFAHGCPVVTTSKGSEGLAVQDGVELLIRDEPQEFARACIELLANKSQRKALAKAGRAFLKTHNSQPVVELQLRAALAGAGISPRLRL